MFKCFEAVSDLCLNLGKNTLIVVGEVLNLDMLAADLECGRGYLPSTYLGLPLGSLYKQKEAWHLVIDRMKQCLNGWKACYLS